MACTSNLHLLPIPFFGVIIVSSLKVNLKACRLEFLPLAEQCVSRIRNALISFGTLIMEEHVGRKACQVYPQLKGTTQKWFVDGSKDRERNKIFLLC